MIHNMSYINFVNIKSRIFYINHTLCPGAIFRTVNQQIIYQLLCAGASESQLLLRKYREKHGCVEQQNLYLAIFFHSLNPSNKKFYTNCQMSTYKTVNRILLFTRNRFFSFSVDLRLIAFDDNYLRYHNFFTFISLYSKVIIKMRN